MTEAAVTQTEEEERPESQYPLKEALDNLNSSHETLLPLNGATGCGHVGFWGHLSEPQKRL